MTLSLSLTRLATCVAGAFLAVGVWAQPGGAPATPVRVDAVRLETVQQMRQVIGNVRPHRRSIVAAEESGLVASAPFDTGDRVRAGEVLAELDAALLRLELAQAEARVLQGEAIIEERRAELERTQLDLERIEQLQAQGAAQPKEVSDARTFVATARARLSEGEHALTLAREQVAEIRERLERKIIRAPFDGYVVQKFAEVGQWVGEGGEVVDLIESGLVDAVVDVPERWVGYVDVGMPLTLTLPAVDEPVTGNVTAVVAMADERARTFPVKVELDDREGLIKPGMSVVGWVPTGQSEQALTLHPDALVRQETRAFVYVMRGGVVMPVDVQVKGSAPGGRFAINAPLQDGDLVVIEGNERLYPGAAVAPVNGGGGPAADEPSVSEESAGGGEG